MKLGLRVGMSAGNKGMMLADYCGTVGWVLLSNGGGRVTVRRRVGGARVFVAEVATEVVEDHLDVKFTFPVLAFSIERSGV